jgi:hypothetical protein
MATSPDKAIQEGILALNARAWGISFGLLAGGALFLATNFLVIKGGVQVGRHLSLLSAFFPGYSVSFGGSLIGFVYAFVCGWALGRIIGAVYNKLALR